MSETGKRLVLKLSFTLSKHNEEMNLNVQTNFFYLKNRFILVALSIMFIREGFYQWNNM